MTSHYERNTDSSIHVDDAESSNTTPWQGDKLKLEHVDSIKAGRNLPLVSASQPNLRISDKDFSTEHDEKDGANSEQSWKKNDKLTSLLWSEMFGQGPDTTHTTAPWWSTQQAYVTNIFNIPWKLEQLLFYSTCICFDSFLFTLTFLPVRSIIALFSFFASMVSKKYKITASQRFDLARVTIFFFSYFLLNTVDASYLYHLIRGQASLKLYVIFNLLEIFDKLCCSFGQDIFDYLFSSFLTPTHPTTSLQPGATPSSSSIKSSKAAVSEVRWRPTGRFLAAYFVSMIYTSIHSFLLFVKVVTLNVSVNAYNSQLLTLLVSANFTELKGIVFKNFRTENLFQISCSDAVERFQILTFLLIVWVNNINDLSWQLTADTIQVLVGIAAVVFTTEILVDWLKHYFITRFNKMQGQSYNHFARTIALEVVKQERVPDPCYATSKRIGFLAMPLSCVIFRVFAGVAPFSGLYGYLWVLSLWAVLLVTKCLMSFIVLSLSVSIVSRVPFATTEKLSHTYAYDKVD